MKKALGLLLTLALATAACGGGAGTDPASANSCDDLAEVSIELLQDALDGIAGMSMADFNALDEPPAGFAALEEKGEGLEQRADELGCTEDDAQEKTCALIDRLTADGEAAQFMLDLFASGC